MSLTLKIYQKLENEKREEEIKRKKAEQYEKEMGKLVIKITALGQDRERRKYWILGGEKDLVFVQEKDNWGCYSSPEEIEKLLEALNPKGIREKALGEALSGVLEKMLSRKKSMETKPEIKEESESQLEVRGYSELLEDPAVVSSFQDGILALGKKMNLGSSVYKLEKQMEEIYDDVEKNSRVLLFFEGELNQSLGGGQGNEAEGKEEGVDQEIGNLSDFDWESTSESKPGKSKLWPSEQWRKVWVSEVKSAGSMAGLLFALNVLR